MSKPKIKRSSERIVRVDPVHPQPEFLAQAAGLIHRGGVVAFPTETFYGLGADALNPQAIKRIYQIKGRDQTKPILILVESSGRIEALVKPFPSMVERLMETFWPGPLTIVFQADGRLPIELTAGTGKIGIRVPSDPVVQALLSAVRVPLTGTSANRADGTIPSDCGRSGRHHRRAAGSDFGCRPHAGGKALHGSGLYSVPVQDRSGRDGTEGSPGGPCRKDDRKDRRIRDAGLARQAQPIFPS